MVHWDRVKDQLELILNAEFQYERMPASEWSRHHCERAEMPASSRLVGSRRHFLLYKEGTTMHTLSANDAQMTPSEIQLVELTVQVYRSQDKRAAGQQQSEDERKAGMIRAWLAEQLEQGVTEAELPATLARSFDLSAKKIPLLVYGDYSDQRKANYQELKKLLHSFFEETLVLIPLQENEWLVLAPETLLQNGEEGEDESAEETLASIGRALHEMLGTEWVGECRVAVDYPIVPSKSLLEALVRLREAMALGQAYQIEDGVCMPWVLQLEQLLDSIPVERKRTFLAQVLKRIELLNDQETLMTLEHFIALDCSVSETAKKLFIHRNTLLYRLDKFKQETGLDVRTFRHAVLVHIALLLYKVTKSA